MSRVIEVAAAALTDASGSVLLARRAPDSHQGGLWEFPGGKIESGETLGQCLRRELAEELGVRVLHHRPLIRLRHDYGDRTVILHVHRVIRFEGVPRGLEGQPLAWVAPARLDDYPMPAADRPIVAALRLPDRYLITPADPPSLAFLLQGVERALAEGIRLFQLRLRNPAIDLPLAARKVADRVRKAGAALLVNSDIALARSLGCGVHLTAGQLRRLDARPLPSGQWVAASCHGPEELAQAQALGADFAVLSPVRETATHPGASPIGWEGFERWVADLPLPVYGLGGLGVQDLDEALAHGAQGVAAIRGLWPDRAIPS